MVQKPVISGNKITIPSNLEYLTDVDNFIESTLKSYGTDESTIADIAISVSELVNNAIEHGSKSKAGKEVTVEISRKNDTVQIRVRDKGNGFDPEKLDDPLADENLLKEVGRGIFIVKSLMDSVDIHTSDKGTTITITKAIK